MSKKAAMKQRQTKLVEGKPKYSYGAYNKIKGNKQAIRITEGCPNNCEYCYEPMEFKIFQIPEIVKEEVLIYDMNLIAKPEALTIINKLGESKAIFELVCGIDYRYLTQEVADALKKNRFIKPRIAWDWAFNEQYRVKDAIDMLIKAGYAARNITVFIICNWRIPPPENIRKLDLCKVWGVKVADCHYDNQTFPNVNPIHWTYLDLKDFRTKVRKHNHLINFRIDPEVKKP